MKSKIVQVKSSAGRYTILCGAGVLRGVRSELAELGEFSSVQVLSSPRVWRALGKEVESALKFDERRHLHLFDDGEPKKNMRTVELVCRELTRAGADRKALIVAVGGGVVGDVAGYVAASYLREIGRASCRERV